MARHPRWLFLAAAAMTMGACGLELVGQPRGTGAPDDASTARPTERVEPADVGEPFREASADADLGCVSDGGFCDECDPDLVLCVRFDGGAVDESRYHHAITLDGTAPVYRTENGLGTIALDGGTLIEVLPSERLRAYDALTIEVLARTRQAPAAAARASIIDRGGGGAIFVHRAADGSLYLVCHGYSVDAGPELGRLETISYFVDGQKLTAFIDGGEVYARDAGPVTTSGFDANAPFVIGANQRNSAVESLDPFLGEIATLRIYTRVKRP